MFLKKTYLYCFCLKTANKQERRVFTVFSTSVNKRDLVTWASSPALHYFLSPISSSCSQLHRSHGQKLPCSPDGRISRRWPPRRKVNRRYLGNLQIVFRPIQISVSQQTASRRSRSRGPSRPGCDSLSAASAGTSRRAATPRASAEELPSIYLAAVLEYLSTEVLELPGKNAKDNKKRRIIPGDLLMAVMSDEELGKLMGGVTIAHGGVVPYIHLVLLPKKAPQRTMKRCWLSWFPPQAGSVHMYKTNLLKRTYTQQPTIPSGDRFRAENTNARTRIRLIDTGT